MSNVVTLGAGSNDDTGLHPRERVIEQLETLLADIKNGSVPLQSYVLVGSQITGASLWSSAGTRNVLEAVGLLEVGKDILFSANRGSAPPPR